MNIKLKIIKIQLELLRSILHILLKFNNPTDKLVVFSSQRLDVFIVKYHKGKAKLADNRRPFINTLNLFSNTDNLQGIRTYSLSNFISISRQYF